ncbi:cytochrome c oxidase subunit II [Novosphingobium beihaiensis]|uniref:Cytochrome c oxidase subunit 2 n=1 Tax=Novosphingobium beihaiensis TaxID=2930389 RepID=A0ABT0BSG4_9SPHN|nr:cytochrome c oxidase subunit II [Novosphingobium beihaiensis]MCJ2187726.1 cytochrome c oxidase subunit II [Novosphingobium beihaiensis]
MTSGKNASAFGKSVKALGLSLASFLAIAAVPAIAQDAAAGSYTPMKPVEGVGMPVPEGIGLQDQYSPTGVYGAWIHNDVLLPIITVITLLVLALLIIVAVRYNRRANPVASKTSHNTLIEVIWTLLPVLILIGIAVPSIDLIAKQYKPAPKGSLTIKVTGNQWFWTYGYPDNGDFEVVSNMLNVPGQPVINNGVREVGSEPWDGPSHLEVDNRMVVPAGEPIRLQVTASDVIHSFAVPSLWFKLDAVPGRINEKVLMIDKPGVYYGQCSELCGAKHGYMPIAVEALPRDKYDAWVLTHPGGVIDGQKAAATETDYLPGEEPAGAAPAADASASPAAVEAE